MDQRQIDLLPVLHRPYETAGDSGLFDHIMICPAASAKIKRYFIAQAEPRRGQNHLSISSVWDALPLRGRSVMLYNEPPHLLSIHVSNAAL